MTITLEQVQAEHDRLGKLIAELAASASQPPTTITIDETEIDLQPGERYAGLILHDDGTPSHHVVLLAAEAESVGWEGAKNGAAESGGELPTRREQSLLFANCKSSFQAGWYWSREEHETDSSCAWSQGFRSGTQHGHHKSYESRARFVRRIPA